MLARRRTTGSVSALASTIAAASEVPAGVPQMARRSMRPTLLEGDVVFVNRLAYDLKFPLTDRALARMGEPRRGDIVTFSSPRDGTRLIKRLVALPGDVVEVVDGALRVHQYTGDPSRTVVAPRDTPAWVREAVERGAGEIVLNCMSSDGARNGYDIAQLRAVRALCSVPLIASGGAGNAQHFARPQIEADLAYRNGAGLSRR